MNVRNLLLAAVLALAVLSAPVTAQAAPTSPQPSYALTLALKYPVEVYGFNADNKFVVEGSARLYVAPGLTFYAAGMHNTGSPVNPWYYSFVSAGAELELCPGAALFVEGERRYAVNQNCVFAGIRLMTSGGF